MLEASWRVKLKWILIKLWLSELARQLSIANRSNEVEVVDDFQVLKILAFLNNFLVKIYVGSF